MHVRFHFQSVHVYASIEVTSLTPGIRMRFAANCFYIKEPVHKEQYPEPSLHSYYALSHEEIVHLRSAEKS